jgi:glucose/arabinose dehydrogenase
MKRLSFWIFSLWITLICMIFYGRMAAEEKKDDKKGKEQGIEKKNGKIKKSDLVKVSMGFEAGILADKLTFPTGITFDDQGRIYVAESGAFPVAKPKVLKINLDGSKEEIKITGIDLDNTLLGITYHQGYLYLSHRDKNDLGVISRITLDGQGETLIEGLPSQGDYHTNKVVFDRQGRMYFGQGTVTNSGVVGPDNAQMRWLSKHPQAHDIPCKDIVLTGQKFTSKNPLTKNPYDKVTTGAFQPFGQARATRIPGQLKCNGAIYRANADGSGLEVYAWGFRNPFAIGFDAKGQLYVTQNGFDFRGSRPINNDPDVLLKVEEGKWYGWPDFSSTLLPVTDPRFGEAGRTPAFLIDHLASGLQSPQRDKNLVAVFPLHSSADQFDFAPATGPFSKFVGDMFVALFGDMLPFTYSTGRHKQEHQAKPSDSGGQGVQGGQGHPANPESQDHQDEQSLQEPSQGHPEGQGEQSKQRHLEEEGYPHAGYSVIRVDFKSEEMMPFVSNATFKPASRSNREGGLERPIDVKFGPDGAMYIVDFGVLQITEQGINPIPQTGAVWKITAVQKTNP